MTAPKKGTKGYEEAVAKRRATIIAKYGSEEAYRDFFRKIGKIGGTKSRNGGFAAKVVGKDGLTGRERAKVAGRKGGLYRTEYVYDAKGNAHRVSDGGLWGSRKGE